MTEVEYFGYNIPGSGTHLIGTAKSQITNTLKYYKEERNQPVEIPSEDDYKTLENITIVCTLPLLKVDHFIDATVRPNVIFKVNANALMYVQQLAQQYESLKRGDLFKFVPGVDMLGLYFLPEHIMQSLRDYDWDQHQKQVEEWLGERERDLNEAENKGFLHRVRETQH